MGSNKLGAGGFLTALGIIVLILAMSNTPGLRDGDLGSILRLTIGAYATFVGLRLFRQGWRERQQDR